MKRDYYYHWHPGEGNKKLFDQKYCIELEQLIHSLNESNDRESIVLIVDLITSNEYFIQHSSKTILECVQYLATVREKFLNGNYTIFSEEEYLSGLDHIIEEMGKISVFQKIVKKYQYKSITFRYWTFPYIGIPR